MTPNAIPTTLRPRGGELAQAFALLRDAERGTRTYTTAWRAIDSYVRTSFPGKSDEDVRQEVLLTIAIRLGVERRHDIRSAAAWVHTIHRRKRIDQHRAARRGRMVSLDDIERPLPVSYMPAIALELAERIVEAFVERVDLRLADVEPDGVRARRRAQTVAAVRRLGLGETLPEISARVAPGASRALVAKWIERGRKVIGDVVEHERSTDPDLADFFAPLAELATERRADAGHPRPARRTQHA